MYNFASNLEFGGGKVNYVYLCPFSYYSLFPILKSKASEVWSYFPLIKIANKGEITGT